MIDEETLRERFRKHPSLKPPSGLDKCPTCGEPTFMESKNVIRCIKHGHFFDIGHLTEIRSKLDGKCPKCNSTDIRFSDDDLWGKVAFVTCHGCMFQFDASCIDDVLRLFSVRDKKRS